MNLLSAMISSPGLGPFLLAIALVGCLLVPCASVIAAPTNSPASDLEAVLAKIRDAAGYRAPGEHSGELLVEGMAEYQGQRGPYTLLFTPQGNFLQTVHLRRNQIVGFDGTTGWAVDWSGTPHLLEFSELESEKTIFFVRTGRWLAEDGPFRIELPAQPADGTTLRLRLQLKQGLESWDLDVDRSTWLPVRLTGRRVGADDVWEFHDYRPVPAQAPAPSANSAATGPKLAYRTVQKFGTGSATFEIQSAKSVAARAATENPFLPRMDPPHDVQFHDSVPARFEVKRVASGHLFVRPKISGEEVGWFFLDTGSGAGTTISPAVADRLKLPAFGKIVQGGAAKLNLGSLREGTTFELGSITIDKPIFVELPQPFCDAMTRMFGLDVVGTCGYDLFSRAVVELDLKHGTASCREPNGYQLKRGAWEPLSFNHKIPCVRARYEGGREGLFQFDTGAGNTVLFHAPAVKRLKLLEQRQTRPMKVGGVGGALDARIGSLEWFEVGGHRLEKPRALFLEAHEGALNEAHLDGTFGSGILKDMTIVFDYPHRRIAFGK
jgi:Aspartyl protease